MFPANEQEFRYTVIQKLTRLEQSVEGLRRDLLGDGQPGRVPSLEVELRGRDTRIGRIEDELQHFRDARNRQKGFWLAVYSILSAGVSAAMEWLYHR